MSATTLAHHAPGLPADAPLPDWQLCPSGPECDVVYFRGEDVVFLPDVRAAPYHKGTGPDRIVCFCFGHTERDVAGEVAQTGRSSIRDTVRDACRQGRSDCERLNPRGGCCLGDVGRVVDATGSSARPSTRSG